MIEPTCAVASVTIENAIPETRSATPPTSRGSATPTTVVSASAGASPQPSSVSARFAT